MWLGGYIALHAALCGDGQVLDCAAPWTGVGGGGGVAVSGGAVGVVVGGGVEVGGGAVGVVVGGGVIVEAVGVVSGIAWP
jgi:hypothetical protein